MTRNRTKNIDNSFSDSYAKSKHRRKSPIQDIATSGLAGGAISEGFPQLIRTDSEQVFGETANANIVVGRDRPSHMGSGYGGLGHTGASSMDLVVGRVGYAEEHVNPDFTNDAARIHISQKTDVDSNFGICAGDLGPSYERSAIAVKADAVRVIGREGIKIISGGDSTNSKDGKIETYSGVEIIANNDDTDYMPVPPVSDEQFGIPSTVLSVATTGLPIGLALDSDCTMPTLSNHNGTAFFAETN